jgi:hypothetical protein
MRCGNCGIENHTVASICVHCGTRLAIPAPPASMDIAQSDGVEDVVNMVIPLRNPPALIAYYCGVFSLIPCFGAPLAVAAVILGIVGLVKAGQTPGTRGRVHAWIGIVLGGLVLLAYVALLLIAGVGGIAANSNYF